VVKKKRNSRNIRIIIKKMYESLGRGISRKKKKKKPKDDKKIADGNCKKRARKIQGEPEGVCPPGIMKGGGTTGSSNFRVSIEKKGKGSFTLSQSLIKRPRRGEIHRSSAHKSVKIQESRGSKGESVFTITK